VSKSETDFLASLTVLEAAITMYHCGVVDSYRLVATELRKLLCDRNALLTRVRPGFQLHKLHWTEMLETRPSLMNGLNYIMPGRLSVSQDGTSHFELTFAQSGALMDVEHWIEQPLFSADITVRELIKSVADKEGAHSDPDFNETLVHAKLVKYMRDDSHKPTIIAIGEYVFRWVHGSGAIST